MLPDNIAKLVSIAIKLSMHNLITFHDQRIAMVHNTIRDYTKRKLTLEEVKAIGKKHVDFYYDKALEELHEKSSGKPSIHVLLHIYDKRLGLSYGTFPTKAFEEFVAEEYLNFIAALEWMAQYDPDEEIAISFWSFLTVVYNSKLEANPRLYTQARKVVGKAMNLPRQKVTDS
jgi:hypothetical protein